MQQPLDVLAVFAHPDDAELVCGGALAKAAARGERVGILDLTRGEMGTRGTPELRAREAQAAAEVLGVRVRHNAGLPDGRLKNSHEARAIVATHLRELRPRVVVTHWLEGRHPDHGAAARLAVDASFLSGLRNADVSGEPHRPLKIVHGTAFRENAPRPSFVVDVTGEIERKLEAIRCFQSQFQGLSAAGEVFAGGDRPLEDQVRAHLAYHGSRIRAAYGEPFWMREVFAVDSLGDLEVATF